MKLYNIQNNKLNIISGNPFKLEKEIQDLIEGNVTSIFDLEFVKSELRIQNFRFDTLCFDKSNNSFVVIEYKKGNSYSVIDQGYSYLSTLLNNKSDFVLEYNESLGKSLKRDQIDWSQSRVIFISPTFSRYQKTSVNFKNLPFELWEITRYGNDVLALNQLITDSDIDINSTLGDDTKSSLVKDVSKQVNRYDEEYHLTKSKKRPKEVIALYHNLKARILEIDENIDLKIGKQTIGFSQNIIFSEVIIYDKGLGIVINLKKGELNDDMLKTEDLSTKKHWGRGEYSIWIKSIEELDYVMTLVKQSFLKQS
tara:strand:- start:117 stop:1046 length:930 start_codon:yes stop_codon:yes gene_type:complete